jgi:DNA-binding transcriptional LysR family regulator
MMGAESLITNLSNRGLLPECRFIHSSDLRLVSRLTAAGGGLGILPDTIAETEHNGPLEPCPQSPVLTDSITLIWRADTQLSRASQHIRNAIRSALQRR